MQKNATRIEYYNFLTVYDLRLRGILSRLRLALARLAGRPNEVVYRRKADVRIAGADSGIFAPPLRPFDHARCASGLHDGPLIGGTEFPIEAG